MFLHICHALCLVNVLQSVVADTVVKVGDNGAFYSPVIVAAPVGSVITFQFVGTAHSVTQSSYDDPCGPMPGGFDSGFAGLQFGGTLEQPMEWNLTITNDSIPIWYHCRSQLPTPHCQTGMVGGINVGPPSTPNANNQSFNAFSSAALNATPTPVTTNVLPSLSGQGAIATATPQTPFTTTVNSSTPTSIPPQTTTIISTSTPSPSATPHHSNTGAIVGGVVGGIVGIAAIAGLLLLLLRSRRKAAILQAEKMSRGGSSWLTTENDTKSSLRTRYYGTQ